MSPDLDMIQRTVVGVCTVMDTLLYRAADTFVCMTVHSITSLFGNGDSITGITRF